MKIALVHDYLREYGGAERVVEVLHEIWPEAPLYTSFVDWPAFAKAPAGKLELFKSMDIRTSWVQDNWLVKKFHSPLRFLAPRIWSSFDLSEYDVVLSSSGWFMCRGVALSSQLSAVSKKKPVHICYIHHPPRNLYGYATGSNLQKYWPVRVYTALINFYLRHYDFVTAQAVDYFVANSKETARRVEKFYRRQSMVIYPPATLRVAMRAGPPVDVKSKFHKGPTLKQGRTLEAKEYFLSVGRLTYSKRVDLAIQACNQLHLPLKIVGTGKEEGYLRSIAARPPSASASGAAGWSPTIEFVGGVSDAELDQLYAGAKALIFCALDEDFGMVPVEAMAHGIPVIGLAQGGVKETVVDGTHSTSSGQETGVLFYEPTVESLVGAIKKFMDSPTSPRLRGVACKNQAEKFSKERFKKELVSFVNSHV